MSQEKIVRHKMMDRIFHWLIAIIVFILLLTGLLPPFGIDFNWVPIHWITGLALTLLVIIHLVRSMFWKGIKNMMLARRDFSRSLPGKYSLEQKLMHNFISAITLVSILTGGLMMVKIDTPFWERDPYWLSTDTWGLVYIAHGLMALVFVSTIMLHIYFALRPEKRLYLRAMIKGWISKDEFSKEHDPELWVISDENNKRADKT